MKHLSKLTPAETLIIQHGDQAPLSDVLKYTLMDLLLKQVLVIEEIQRQPSSHDPVRAYKYVAPGRNFSQYQGKFHELVFLSVFQENTSMKILFRNLVKIGYQKAKSPLTLYPSIINRTDLKGAFSRTFYQWLFGGFKHTFAGAQFRDEVQNEIKELEKNIPDLLARDRNRGIAMLKAISGNIFLLKGLDSALAAEIDKELFEEMAGQNDGRGGSGCSGWIYFDNHSGDFDNSCSSDSGTWGDGGSGCSGDSGCSGCGGGCGGD